MFKYQHILHSLIRIQFCLITVCWKNSNADDCFLPQGGLNYMGSINISSNKHVCQRWSTNSPHEVSFDIKDRNFPDGSKAVAQNFCRNPMPDLRDGPWCYTTSQDTEWDYCTICPNHNNDQTVCSLPNEGKSYRGIREITRGGFRCDFWKSHPDDGYTFPDQSIESARNFCRNPKTTGHVAPWCYTTDAATTWDYCDVCMPFRGAVTKQPGKKSPNAIGMSGMTLTNCRQWCINFLGCISVEFTTKDSGCAYHPYIESTMEDATEVDLYLIKRICPARANKKPAYFTIYRRSVFVNNVMTKAAESQEACDDICIEDQRCQAVYFSDKACFYTEDYNSKHIYQIMGKAKHIVRCQTYLEPEQGHGMTPPGYEELLIAVTDAAELGDTSEFSTAGPLQGTGEGGGKDMTAKLISMLVVGVTLVGIGSSIFGCIKTRQLAKTFKRDNKDIKGKEQPKRIVPGLVNKIETNERRKSLRR